MPDQKEVLSVDEVVEAIKDAMSGLDGDQLADLYSEHLGVEVTYIGDSMFEVS